MDRWLFLQSWIWLPIRRMNLEAVDPRYSATYPRQQDHGNKSLFIRSLNGEILRQGDHHLHQRPTGVAKEREVDIERWEIQIAHECRVSRGDQREKQDGDGDRGVSEDT